MFSYRQMLLQTFRITWKNRYLWFFGLFASLLSIGAEYQILTRAMSRGASLTWFSDWSNFFNSGLFSWGFFPNLIGMFGQDPVTMSIALVISLVLLAALLLLIWLAIISQIAIVNNSNKIINSKKEVADLNLHSGVLAGNKSFWSVLWFNVISKIVVNVLVFLVSLPLIFLFWNKIFSGTLYILLFIFLIPLAVAFSLMIKYAIAFVVLKKESFGKALNSAIKLFTENWIVSLEVAFLLFAISFFATFVILTASLVVALPFVALAAVILSAFTSVAFWSVVVLGIIVLTAFIVICGSILGTFQVVAWTNLFNHLGRGIESKLERLAPDHIKNKPVSFK
ncbi:MAG: hypothetical protein WCJ57_03995 [Candidatus Falkowbacteria bacterium]